MGVWVRWHGTSHRVEDSDSSWYWLLSGLWHTVLAVKIPLFYALPASLVSSLNGYNMVTAAFLYSIYSKQYRYSIIGSTEAEYINILYSVDCPKVRQKWQTWYLCGGFVGTICIYSTLRVFYYPSRPLQRSWCLQQTM